MDEFRRAREHMVTSQVHTSSVSDLRILAQMRIVPRETFVNPARRPVAYVDDIQWYGRAGTGRFMAPPALIGKLLQLCRIGPADDVLVVGAGTGYSTALVAGLAATVTGLESDPALAAAAQQALANTANAAIVEGDLTVVPPGLFDVIFVEGALNAVPDGFLSALKDGGRLVVPLLRSGVPVAHLVEKRADGVHTRAEFKAALPLLVPDQTAQSFVF